MTAKDRPRGAAHSDHKTVDRKSNGIAQASAPMSGSTVERSEPMSFQDAAYDIYGPASRQPQRFASTKVAPPSPVLQTPARRPQTLTEAIAAFEAHEPVYRAAARAHIIAEEAAGAVERPVVEPPEVLKVTSPGFAMVRGDRRIEIEPTTHILKTEEEVIGGNFSDERKAEMLAALTHWAAERSRAEQAAGYTVLERAEKKAEAAWHRAMDRREVLARAVLKARAATAAEIRTKMHVFAKAQDAKRPQDIDWNGPLQEMVGAVVRDLDHMAGAAQSYRDWQKARAVFEGTHVACGQHPTEEALDRAAEAQRVMELTPAPDVGALLFKLQSEILFNDGVEGAGIAEALGRLNKEGGAGAFQVSFYNDLCRLAGAPLIDPVHPD